jgi:hypothetical protein
LEPLSDGNDPTPHVEADKLTIGERTVIMGDDK